jgi:hypothetical protein
LKGKTVRKHKVQISLDGPDIIQVPASRLEAILLVRRISQFLYTTGINSCDYLNYIAAFGRTEELLDKLEQ